MHHTFARVPAHFFRVSLHSENDNMTLALVPDQENANLIARILRENYGLRQGESILVAPTSIRPVEGPDVTHVELAIKQHS